MSYLHCVFKVCTSPPPLPFCWGVNLVPKSYQNCKKERLHRSSIFRRGLLVKKELTFFKGGCSFYIENKLKSEIFNNKKSLLTKMFFSAFLNCDILTKNLVTFKRRNGVKDEKFEYYGGSLENLVFKWGVHEKPINRGNAKKGRAWAVGRFKGALSGLRWFLATKAF